MLARAVVVLHVLAQHPRTRIARPARRRRRDPRSAAQPRRGTPLNSTPTTPGVLARAGCGRGASGPGWKRSPRGRGALTSSVREPPARLARRPERSLRRRDRDPPAARSCAERQGRGRPARRGRNHPRVTHGRGSGGYLHSMKDGRCLGDELARVRFPGRHSRGDRYAPQQLRVRHRTADGRGTTGGRAGSEGRAVARTRCRRRRPCERIPATARRRPACRAARTAGGNEPGTRASRSRLPRSPARAGCSA